jgi:hypothetical protein
VPHESLRSQVGLAGETCTTCRFDPLSDRAFSGGSWLRHGGPLDEPSHEQGHIRSRGTAAAVFVLPTLTTGILAWQLQFAGKKLKGLLLLHLGLGCTAGLLICLVAWVHSRQRRVSASALPAYYLPLEILTAAVIGLAAHVGGFLTGVNAAG